MIWWDRVWSYCRCVIQAFICSMFLTIYFTWLGFSWFNLTLLHIILHLIKFKLFTFIRRIMFLFNSIRILSLVHFASCYDKRICASRNPCKNCANQHWLVQSQRTYIPWCINLPFCALNDENISVWAATAAEVGLLRSS